MSEIDYNKMAPSAIAPARWAAAVTPSDALDLPRMSRAIYLGGGGDLAVEMVDQPGEAVVIPAMKSGVVYPLFVTKVFATGTTATGIIMLA